MIAVTLVFLCQGHQAWPDLGLTSPSPPTQAFTEREREMQARTYARMHAHTHTPRAHPHSTGGSVRAAIRGQHFQKLLF